MNKKDVDNLGFILSDGDNFDDIRRRIFELDIRIEESFNEFEEVAGRSDAVDELFDKIMIERYGNNWPISRKTPNGASREVLIEARKEVYGDDYDCIFSS